MENNNDGFISLKEAAAKSGLSVITLRRYIKAGTVSASKVGKSYFLSKDVIERIASKSTLLSEGLGYVAKGLNDKTEFKYHVSRKDLFHKARDIFAGIGEKNLAKEANFDANIFAYTYINLFNKRESLKKWGRFAPVGSGTDESGQEHFFPDPRWIDDDMVSHAKKRVTQTDNPLTLSIYFDLIVEYSTEKDKRYFAEKAIENYLSASEIQYASGWEFEFLDSLTRSLELSLKFKFSDKTTEIIEMCFDSIKRFNADGKPRYSFEIFEVLLSILNQLTEKQIREIIKYSRLASEYFGDKKGDNRHLQREFLGIPLKIARSKKRSEEVSKIELEIIDSLLNEASEKSASGLVEAHFLEEALKRVHNLKDPRNEEANIRQKIEAAYIKSQSEMKPISVSFEFTEKQRQDYVNSILAVTNTESLLRIGAIPDLIPSYQKAEDQTKKLIKDHPLQYIFKTDIIQDGRRVSSIGGGLSMSQDHILQTFSMNMNTHNIFLKFLFDELQQRGVNDTELIQYLSDKYPFKYDNFDALAEGIKAYYRKDYFSAVTIIVTQTEEVLRNLLRRIGYPTLKVVRGHQEAIQMPEILESQPFTTSFSNDLLWYLRLTFFDKRGRAIRDPIAHGLYKKSTQNEYDCYVAIHILLILATLEIKEKSKEN